MKRMLLLSLVIGLFACGDDTSSNNVNNTNNTNNSNNANNQNNANNGDVDCQPQTEVSQTLFEGDVESVLLADVPAGWETSRFDTSVGYLAKAPSASGSDRPEVGVNNMGVVTRAIVDVTVDDLDPLTSVMIYGEEVTFYFDRNQPAYGINLTGFVPTAMGSDMYGTVAILGRFMGSNAEMTACQDSLLDLVTLVADSVRANPEWGG